MERSGSPKGSKEGKKEKKERKEKGKRSGREKDSNALDSIEPFSAMPWCSWFFICVS